VKNIENFQSHANFRPRIRPKPMHRRRAPGSIPRSQQSGMLYSTDYGGKYSIPTCAPAPPGCKYIFDPEPELGTDGNPRYPCGRLDCDPIYDGPEFESDAWSQSGRSRPQHYDTSLNMRESYNSIAAKQIIHTDDENRHGYLLGKRYADAVRILQTEYENIGLVPTIINGQHQYLGSTKSVIGQAMPRKYIGVEIRAPIMDQRWTTGTDAPVKFDYDNAVIIGVGNIMKL